MKKVGLADIMELEKIAERLGVSKGTIERWRSRGMPVISVGNYIRGWMPEILDWLVQQKEASDPEDK